MKGYYNCLKCIKISFPVVEGLILKGYYNLNILEMH